MNVGISVMTPKPAAKNEQAMTLDQIDLLMTKTDMMMMEVQRRSDALENLYTLKKWLENGKAELACEVFEGDITLDQVNQMIKSSEEDFKNFMVNVGIGLAYNAISGGYPGIVGIAFAAILKKAFNSYYRSKSNLIKRYNEVLKKLGDRELTDQDVLDVRSAYLSRHQSWINQATNCSEIYKLLKGITPANASQTIAKIRALLPRIGYKLKDSGKSAKITFQGFWDPVHYVGEKAGSLGWTADRVKAAVPILGNLLKEPLPLETLNKLLVAAKQGKVNGMTENELARHLKSICLVLERVTGRMGQGLIVLLSKIK